MNGTLHRSGLPAVPARRHEALPEGRALLHGEVRDREAQPRRPGSTASCARRSWSATACSCARSRRSSASTACSRTSSAATSRWRTARAASPARRCCSCSSGGSTTSSTASAWRPRAPQARQLVRHGHFTVNGRKVDMPSYSLKAGDVVTVRGTSAAERRRSSTRSKKSRAAASPSGCRSTPATLTGRVASLPTREQINLPVQEQLIVELYSASSDSCQLTADQLQRQLSRSQPAGPQPSRPAAGGGGDNGRSGRPRAAGPIAKGQ